MRRSFSPWQLGGLEIPNRFVRSATWEGMAEADGTVTPALAEVTADLVRGGVGLIISGYAYVRPEGLGLPRQTGAYDDSLVPSLRLMADAVHEAGGRIALQIVHAGGQTRAEWIGGATPLGPSAMEQPGFGDVAELTILQIEEIVAAFGDAARRGKEAGFDAVQLHGAHGYLINQFLSPHTNRREDAYGGDLEGRARFALEVYDAARAAVGASYPVFIKLNSEDCVEGGLELPDAVEVARLLSERGIDAVEVSGGVPAAGKQSPSRVLREPSEEGYFLENARAIQAVVDCPVISVGGYRSLSVIEAALEHVDAVAICRPFIRQPDLVNRFRDGLQEKAECISCGRCFKETLKHGLTCGVVSGAE